jgi:hypothetical protein
MTANGRALREAGESKEADSSGRAQIGSTDVGRTGNEFDPNLKNIASMLVKRRRCSRLFGA